MIEIRALHEHAEFAEAVRLQRTIWGFEELELLPVRLFVEPENPAQRLYARLGFQFEEDHGVYQLLARCRTIETE